ncbi:MAG: oligosaccharide flippase family protein [Planctomycetota bacterium]
MSAGTAGQGQGQGQGVEETPPLGSAAVLSAARFAAVAINFGVSAYLMRRLGPGPFGLVGMANGLMTIVSAVGDAGLRDALVAEREACPRRTGAALVASVALAATLLLLTLASAPLVVAFYQREEVLWPWLAAGLTVTLHLLAVVPVGLAWRAERFRLMAGVGLLGAVVAAAAALPLSHARGDVWPILAWQGASPLVLSLALWLAIRPRVAWPDRAALSGLWSFSRGVLGSQALTVLERNADDVVIGRFLGERALGHYTLCYRVLTMPLTLISDVFTTVAYPRLAREVDRARTARALGGLLYAVALLSTPLALGVALAAPELLEVVFGLAWAEALVPLRLLALLGIVAGPARLLGLAYRAARDTDALARWGLLSAPFVVGSFFLGLPWGVAGVAGAYALVSLLLFPWNARHAARSLGQPTAPLLRETARGVALGALASLGMLAACLGARALGAPAWGVLLATVGAGALTELLVLRRVEPALRAEPAPGADPAAEYRGPA